MDQLVRDVAAAYLSTVDREAPALIEALYLVGSVTLDDFHPGASDIDFIAVTSRPLSEADLSALTRTHAALATWTRRNLDDYWRPWHRRSSRLLSRPGLACLTPWGPAWGVLGVSRLHYTLATGDITSKRGAGEYARTAFAPRWHRILNECLRIRLATPGPSLYPNPLTRRREALTFVSMAIDAGWGCWRLLAGLEHGHHALVGGEDRQQQDVEAEQAAGHLGVRRRLMSCFTLRGSNGLRQRC